VIEVSIIVQLREVTEDGRHGRAAIGISRFDAPTAAPQKSWRLKFEGAAIRAQADRSRQLEELQELAGKPHQAALAFQSAQPRDPQPRGIQQNRKKGSQAQEEEECAANRTTPTT